VQGWALEGDVHLEVKTDVRAGKRGNTTTLTVNRKLRLPFFMPALHEGGHTRQAPALA